MAVLVRLLLLPVDGFVFDRNAFTEWIVALQTHPVSSFYQLPHATPPDHLPGTLLILFVLGHVISLAHGGGAGASAGLTPEQAEPFLKMVPIVADIINGALLFCIAKSFVSARRAVVVAAAYLFNPGVIFVSAIWGQWDAVSMIFVLIALLLAVSGPIVAVLPFITLAVLMKPQLVLLVPILVVYLAMRDTQTMPRRVWWRRSGWSAAVSQLSVGALLSVAIATVAGLPFRVSPIPIDGMMTYSERLAFAADRYHGTTYGAISLWLIPLGTGIPPDDTHALLGPLTYALAGTVLVIASMIAAIVLCVRMRWSFVGLLAGTSVMALGFAIFSTRTHERYLFPAIVIGLLLWGVSGRLGGAVLALSAGFFASVYFAYSYFDDHVPLRTLRTNDSMIALGVLGVIVFAAMVVGVWRMATPEKETEASLVPSRQLNASTTGRLRPTPVVGGQE